MNRISNSLSGYSVLHPCACAENETKIFTFLMEREFSVNHSYVNIVISDFFQSCCALQLIKLVMKMKKEGKRCVTSKVWARMPMRDALAGFS